MPRPCCSRPRAKWTRWSRRWPPCRSWSSTRSGRRWRTSFWTTAKRTGRRGDPMGVTVLHALARSRAAVLAWGLVLSLLGTAVIASYDVVKKEQDKVADIARSFAPIIQAMGGNIDNLAG